MIEEQDIKIGDLFRLVKTGLNNEWVEDVTERDGYIFICTGCSRRYGESKHCLRYSGKSIATGAEHHTIWRSQMEKADV